MNHLYLYFSNLLSVINFLSGRIVQKKRPDNTDWVIPIPVVAGVGGALLLLIVLVVIIILYLR